MSEKEVQSAEEAGESGAEERVKFDWKNQCATFDPSCMPPALRRLFLKQKIKNLPVNSQKCVKALKNLQLEQLHLEVKFFEEVFLLQKKYFNLYEPLHDKRAAIVSGSYTPSERESEYKSDSEDEYITENDKKFLTEYTKKFPVNLDPDAKGIPSFWLTVFRNAFTINEMIKDHDEEALKHLMDVKLVYKDNDHMSYVIEFHFEPNEYFSNTVLTKQYFLRSTLNDEPFLFEGPEIYKCVGCDINWHKGMNLTVKTIRKKQKHKARNAVRTVTKQVPTESFFHFFNPPEVSEDLQNVEQEKQNILSNDFEVGHLIRERIIPKAALYYTGDIVDDDDDDDLDDEEGEEEEEEEEDEEDEKSHTNKAHKKGGNPADCPQQ